MEAAGIIRIVAVSVLCTLVEYLLPTGNMKKSGAVGLRMLALLYVAQTLLEWVR